MSTSSLKECYLFKIIQFKLKLSVLKSGTIQDLCAALETCLSNVPKSNLLVCDVYSQKFYKIFESHESIQSIGQKDDIRMLVE